MDTYQNVQIEALGYRKTVRLVPMRNPNPPRNRSTPTKIDFISSDGSERIRIVGGKPEDGERVVAHTAQQKFSVRRNSPSEPYFLEKMYGGEGNWPAVERWRGHIRDAPYRPGNCPGFPKGVGAPEFKVQEVTRLVRDGHREFTFRFQFVPKDHALPELEGRMTVDESLNWVIREFDFDERHHMENQKVMVVHQTGSNDYKLDRGAAIPTEIRFSQTFSQAVRYEYRYEITKFVLGPTPAEQFKLASFGLGDFDQPTEVTSRLRSHWKKVLVSCAFAISMMLLWMGWARHKRRKGGRSDDHPQTLSEGESVENPR
jgi:hypothetical protein